MVEMWRSYMCRACYVGVVGDPGYQEGYHGQLAACKHMETTY